MEVRSKAVHAVGALLAAIMSEGYKPRGSALHSQFPKRTM